METVEVLVVARTRGNSACNHILSVDTIPPPWVKEHGVQLFGWTGTSCLRARHSMVVAVRSNSVMMSYLSGASVVHTQLTLW